MDEKEFPCYYIDSDNASKEAQSNYKRLIWLSLILMFLATLVESLAFAEPIKQYSAYAIFLSGFISVLLTLKKPERRWYKGRAIAESIKTLSWRYMMHVEPFDSDEEAENLRSFTERMDLINKQANQEGFIAKPNKLHSDVITVQMEQVRQKSFLERKEFYKKQRIENQLEWYGKKSRQNRLLGSFCSWSIFVCQIVAGIYLLKYQSSSSEINLNAIMVFLATSLIAIVELNKFKDLHHAYGLTHQELNIIRSRFGLIHDDLSFSQFVLEAEQAISREHTMWLARRA